MIGGLSRAGVESNTEDGETWVKIRHQIRSCRSASASGPRFADGDFFVDELPRADVLVMGHILHDWGLDEKRTLISKAYEALPEEGALIVYETSSTTTGRKTRSDC